MLVLRDTDNKMLFETDMTSVLHSNYWMMCLFVVRKFGGKKTTPVDDKK